MLRLDRWIGWDQIQPGRNWAPSDLLWTTGLRIGILPWAVWSGPSGSDRAAVAHQYPFVGLFA
jgi:hypothetical protein